MAAYGLITTAGKFIGRVDLDDETLIDHMMRQPMVLSLSYIPGDNNARKHVQFIVGPDPARPETIKTLVRRDYVSGMSITEIAEKHNLPENSVRLLVKE